MKINFEELNTEKLKAFQVYSQDGSLDLNLLVDKIWIENERIYFRVLDILSGSRNHLRREIGKNIYSIHEKDIFSIRCRLYLQNHKYFCTNLEN